MGWLPWSGSAASPDPAGSNSNKDLQQFIADELLRPPPQEPAAAPAPSQKTDRTAAQPRSAAPTPAPAPTSEPGAGRSAFPDGRYAHLWKSYRPVAEVEQAAQDHSARLQDLSHRHRQRERRLDEAARENCALEAEALADCYKRGKTVDLLTMCLDASSAKSACLDMQTRFLRALGYMATPAQAEDTLDRIQIHADRLYRQMVEQEKAAEEAVRQGRQLSSQKPVMDREAVIQIYQQLPLEPTPAGRPPTAAGSGSSARTGTDTTTATASSSKIIPIPYQQVLQRDPKAKAQYEKAIKGKTAEQIALIQREIEGEAIFKQAGNDTLQSYMDIERQERAARKESGQQRLGDYLLNWAGFNSAPQSKD